LFWLKVEWSKDKGTTVTSGSGLLTLTTFDDYNSTSISLVPRVPLSDLKMLNKNGSKNGLSFEMMFHQSRLASFTDWPFPETSKCSANTMAMSGFYKLNPSYDCVKCFFCEKELEGWEEGDDPFQEHKQHVPSCPFVKDFDSPPTSYSVYQMMDWLSIKCENLLRKEEDVSSYSKSFQLHLKGAPKDLAKKVK